MHYQPDYNAIHTYYDVSDRAGKLADMPLGPHRSTSNLEFTRSTSRTNG